MGLLITCRVGISGGVLVRYNRASIMALRGASHLMTISIMQMTSSLTP